jgi:uncharacterized protein (TIGR00730 family)
MVFRRVGVFCGSSMGADPAYAEAARVTGRGLAERGIELVYGGGNNGLMGVLANAALAAGGRVTGVIPEFLMAKEVGHRGVTELVVVDSMHERKARMASMAEAFLALPGGCGTFDELFEIVTWAQLRLHAKPIGVLNINGFYDPLLALLDQALQEGFLTQSHRELVMAGRELGPLLERMAVAAPLTIDKV